MRESAAQVFTSKELRRLERLPKLQRVARCGVVAGVVVLLLGASGDVYMLARIAGDFGLSGREMLDAAFGPMSDPGGECRGYQLLLYRHFLRALIEILGAPVLLVFYVSTRWQRRIISKFLKLTAVENGSGCCDQQHGQTEFES